MIPAFSIGRTQEILYELEGLIFEAQQQQTSALNSSKKRAAGHVDWSKLQVIVDSPLASKFTNIYRELKPFWDAEAQQRLRAGRHPLSFENLITIDSHEAYLKTVAFLARTKQPAVVLAASGMAAGGRIVDYLKAMLGDEAHCVLFVGYQARGTTGHRLQQLGRKKAKMGEAGPASFVPHLPTPHHLAIDGRSIDVKAQIRSIGGYSAHADQKDLVNFVKRMRKWPTHVRIIHGERSAREGLRVELKTLAQKQGRSMDIVLPDKA
jgi:metallo-beta-lactamase family protein